MTGTPTPTRAVVLASGGLDSTVTAALARQAGHELIWLTVDYGQRHAVEIERARRLAAAMSVARHTVVSVDLRAIGGSALTSDVAVPKTGRVLTAAMAFRPPTCRAGTSSFFLLPQHMPKSWAHP